MPPPADPAPTTFVRRLPLPSGGAARLHLARFVAERFDPSSFDRSGIALPPGIAASVRKRQAEFFHGRWAARMALRELGATSTHVAMGSAGEPVWPRGVTGSLSHIDGLAGAVVLLRDGLLGIDLERTARGAAQEALRALAIDERELSVLRSCAGRLTLDELVTLAFSAKECFYKGVFPAVRRFVGFGAARVVDVDADLVTAWGTIGLRIVEDLSPEFAPGSRCEVAFVPLGEDVFASVLASRRG